MMHESINNLTRQIRINLGEGDPPAQAIERKNVKKALEIIACRISQEPKWLLTMSKDELVDAYEKARKE